MLDGEKEKAVNQYQLLFKLIKRIQLEKYYKVHTGIFLLHLKVFVSRQGVKRK
jgi:hypothetical protein